MWTGSSPNTLCTELHRARAAPTPKGELLHAALDHAPSLALSLRPIHTSHRTLGPPHVSRTVADRKRLAQRATGRKGRLRTGPRGTPRTRPAPPCPRHAAHAPRPAWCRAHVPALQG